MTVVDFRLYLITDRLQLAPGRDFFEVIESALKAGVRAVQLREKDLSARELLELACELKKLTLKYGARLFINERADITVAVEADGVHLPVGSFTARDVRSKFKNLLIGVSTHSIDEARQAEKDGADFITFGPVFATASKVQYGEPLGLEKLKRCAKHIKVPVFALGGITQDFIKDVKEAGAFGVGLISAIMASPEPEQSAKELLKEINE